MENLLQKLLYAAAFAVWLIFPAHAAELIMLKGRLDSASAAVSPVKRVVSADSARVVSPRAGSVLTADSVIYEIELAGKADSVALWVRHSQKAAETLGVFTSPPYKAVWNSGGAEDQDQIHLQFGYTLFCPDTLIVTSPALPHRWVLERGGKHRSKKSYPVKEALNPDSFPVDCDLSKWKNVKGRSVGDAAEFKMLWSKFKLFFIVRVKTDSVSRDDFVELHLDLYRDRSSFSGINHRSIRFSPLSRSNSFVVDLNDGSFTLNDSVNVLISREMEWKKVIDSGGYIIEAMIPFVALSDKEFPSAKFGFDVSVMGVDKTGKKVFHSWAGAEEFSRYSPKNWGTARLSQAWFALKAVFILLLSVMVLTLILIALNAVLRRRKTAQYEKQEARGFLPLTEAVISCIEERLSDEKFCMEDVLKTTGKTKEDVDNAMKQDLDSDFDRQLLNRRIKRSQSLMRNPEFDMETIAAMSGFCNAEEFTKQYMIQMRVDPQISRAALLEQIMEETREEEEN